MPIMVVVRTTASYTFEVWLFDLQKDPGPCSLDLACP